MTGRQHSSLGDLVALRTQDPDSVEDLAAAVVRAPDPSSSPAADLSNVIPFARARRTGAESSMPPVTIRADDRPAPPPAAGARRQFALVACSIAIHSVLFYAFWQQPKELPSIGIEAITVEIMVGDNRPAGVAPSPGENEAVPVPSPEVKAEDKPVEQEQQQVAEAREVTPEEKQPETAKEQPPEDRPDIAMVETPNAETPTALPRETPPEMSAVIVPPREQPEELQPVVEPKAKQPVQKKAEQKKEQKQAARPPPSTPSDAASGSGKRAVASDPNYPGRVSAHLRRFQQYPAAARSGGIQGAGTVTFSLSGSGSVTSASVVRSTGNGILDQELAAMVRRASPFPAPPDGRPKSFTQTVNWNLR